MTSPDSGGRRDPASPSSNLPKPPPLAERLPDPTPPKKAVPVRKPGAVVPRATPEQVANAEKHIRQANLLRIRGELKQSLSELVKAIEANPYDPAPHLMSAEMLRNVGRPADAVTALEHAIDLSTDPGERTVAEAKLARLVAEQNAVQGVGVQASPLSRNRTTIVLATVLIPGLGQLLAGHTTKAAVFFALWLALFVGSVAVIDNASGHGVATLGVVSLVGVVVVWFAALIDVLNENRKD